jgi:hypothetical protein
MKLKASELLMLASSCPEELKDSEILSITKVPKDRFVIRYVVSGKQEAMIAEMKVKFTKVMPYEGGSL